MSFKRVPQKGISHGTYFFLTFPPVWPLAFAPADTRAPSALAPASGAPFDPEGWKPVDSCCGWTGLLAQR